MQKKTADNGEVNFIASTIRSLSTIKDNKFAYAISRNIDRAIAEYKIVQGLFKQAVEKYGKSEAEFEQSKEGIEFFEMESGFDPFIIKQLPKKDSGEVIDFDASQIRLLEFLMDTETFEATFNSDENGKPTGPPVK